MDERYEDMDTSPKKKAQLLNVIHPCMCPKSLQSCLTLHNPYGP